MKVGTLAVHIAAFSRSLSRAEAPSHPAILDEFVKLLSGRDEATVAAFLKNATKNRAPKGVGIGPNASDVVPALSNLRDFFAEIGKKDVAESAGAIIEFLERPKALERILYRHCKLMNFAAGSASIGGLETS
jgi:hypothetical protein